MRSTTRGRRRGCLRGIALVGVWLAMVCQGAENPATEPLPIRNPGFEEVGQDGSLNGWGRWWQRNGKGSATIVEDAHGGRRAIRIQNDDVRDWALTNGKMFEVPQGGQYVIRAWVKATKPGGAHVQASAYDANRKLITWSLGAAELEPGKPGEWQEIFGHFVAAPPVRFIQVRLVGSGPTDVIFDDLSIRPGLASDIPAPPKPPPSPKVEGFAKRPVTETFGRGLWAQRTDEGVYLSWRLLADEPADTGFDVFRLADGKPVRLNASPIIQTSDWLDTTVGVPAGAEYEVRVAGRPEAPAGRAAVLERDDEAFTASRVYRLSDPTATVGKVGIGDLNGDGVYDVIAQHPSSNVDPWHKYWKPSKATFKLDAFLADGTRLWTFDRGWSIECGVWYSPFVVADVTGDGRAEVILKAGEGDPRTTNGADRTDLSEGCNGMVESGDEFILVLDGMTGKEIARAPWPSREGFKGMGHAYNYYSRNQLAVARLDGRTPCIVALRGTYNLMLAEAWQLKDGRLEPVWKYSSRDHGRRYSGQGAHTTIIADVDGDGRDEVVLGSAVIDDNGDPLWTTGRGHPDGLYYGDLIPSRPGMEMAYVMETHQRISGGLHILDPKTGTLIWGLPEPAGHVHGGGLCADIDPLYPGIEFAAMESVGDHKKSDRSWLFSADGKLLAKGADNPFGFGQLTLYWDADLQKELLRGKPQKYQGGEAGGRFQGRAVLVADVVGDWREEVYASVPGELRLTSTPIPAMDRRPCLMQDYGYRMRVQTNAQGYYSDPCLGRLPSAEAPNLNLTYQHADGQLRIVVTAPQKSPLQGTVRLLPQSGLAFDADSFDVSLQPAGIQVLNVKVRGEQLDDGFRGLVRAEMKLSDGRLLKGRIPIVIPTRELRNAVYAEAEDFVAQTGGEVKVRVDKKGIRGKAISHWDSAGHTLTWRLTVREAGTYAVAARYCNSSGAWRSLKVDGRPVGDFFLFGTGGLGDAESDWDHFFAIRNGQRLLFELTPGTHTIELTNTRGQACNLDYVAFVKMK